MVAARAREQRRWRAQAKKNLRELAVDTAGFKALDKAIKLFELGTELNRKNIFLIRDEGQLKEQIDAMFARYGNLPDDTFSCLYEWYLSQQARVGFSSIDACVRMYNLSKVFGPAAAADSNWTKMYAVSAMRLTFEEKKTLFHDHFMKKGYLPDRCCGRESGTLVLQRVPAHM